MNHLRLYEEYSILDHSYPGYDIFFWKIRGRSKEGRSSPIVYRQTHEIDECYILECTEEEKDKHVKNVNNKNYSYYITNVTNLGNDTSKFHWKLKTVGKDDRSKSSEKFFGTLKELKNHIGKVNSRNYSYVIVDCEKK